MSLASDRVVTVGVPVPLRRVFHYLLPPSLTDRAMLGQRVQVRFGPKRLVGYILELDSTPPPGVALSTIEAILDDAEPTFDAGMLGLLGFMADYYRAPIGELLRAAHPSGTNVEFEVVLTATPSGLDRVRAREGKPRELELLNRLSEQPRSMGDLEKKPSADLVKMLVEKGLIVREDRVVAPRVQVRYERCIEAVAPPPVEGRRLARHELLAYLVGRGAVPMSSLRDTYPRAAEWARALVAEGTAVIVERETLRDPFFGEPVVRDKAPELHLGQAHATRKIVDRLGLGYAAFLLHGITGSGKTEVYLRVIEAALARGQSALVLVPEIALTPQLVRRFRARFGDAIAVLHSGLSVGARFDQWRRLRAGEVRVAIGARSGLFAPIRDLGVIIVDEEHDPSYKAGDGTRYQARDMALVRGHREQALVVLGSATPSLESTYNAQAGKLTRLVLTERPTGANLAEIELVDLRVYKQPKDEAPFLSIPLRNALAETLGRGEQAILFLNRRGYCTFVKCLDCGQTMECGHCAVSMVWHRGPQLLRCHYCDRVRALPSRCPACSRPSLGLLGQGTERVEDALRLLYPEARIARLDRDTATGRGLQDILDAMREGRIDLLVGTQMVTKGHDFPNVTLVGVLAADSALCLPDFRAAERTFQLLTQVAGRAGRGRKVGRVLIQSLDPDAPCLQAVRRHDYASFATQDLTLRQTLGYPPFAHAIALRLEGADAKQVEAAALELAAALRSAAEALTEVRLKGPAPAAIERVRGKTRWAMLLLAPRREPLRRVLSVLDSWPPLTGDTRLIVDVDPQDFM